MLVQPQAIDALFSILLLTVDFKNTKGRTKTRPYSITALKAAEALYTLGRMNTQTLELFIHVNPALLSSRESVHELLNTFVAARLFHCSSDPFKERISPKCDLQPTPKGIAHFQLFIRDNIWLLEMPKYPPKILTSLHNSMVLLELVRSPISGLIELSPAVAVLVWRQMLGKQPRIYEPDARPETVKAPHLCDIIEMTFDAKDPDVLSNPSAEGISPYYSKYMTHPSTNATCQYFDSSGVRLFKDLKFDLPTRTRGFRRTNKTYTLDLVVTGKAMWQWVMECTTVLGFEEAASIVKMFIEKGFVEQITDPVAEAVSTKDDMPPELSRTTFYNITSRGRECSMWEPPISTIRSSSPSESLTVSSSESDSTQDSFHSLTKWKQGELVFDDVSMSNGYTIKYIMSEPGLKMLFGKLLRQSHCIENLMFCDQYLHYKSLQQSTSNEFNLHEKSAHALELWRAHTALIKCFFDEASQFQLNIAENIRKSVLDLFLNTPAHPTADDIYNCLRASRMPLKTVHNQIVKSLEDHITRFMCSEELHLILREIQGKPIF